MIRKPLDDSRTTSMSKTSRRYAFKAEEISKHSRYRNFCKKVITAAKIDYDKALTQNSKYNNKK